MLASARAAGLSAYFLNHLPIVESRIGHLYRKLDRFGLAGLARPFLMILNMTQVLILEKPAS